MTTNVPDEFKMRREQADPWLDRLRNGELAQARSVLVNHDYVEGTKAYCCLGVRALVAGATMENDEHVMIDGLNIAESSMLDDDYAKRKFGLDYEVQLLLARLNDGTTAWIKADHPLLDVYKEIALKATPNEAYEHGSSSGHVQAGVTCEFARHDFKAIADVIE